MGKFTPDLNQRIVLALVAIHLVKLWARLNRCRNNGVSGKFLAVHLYHILLTLLRTLFLSEILTHALDQGSRHFRLENNVSVNYLYTLIFRFSTSLFHFQRVNGAEHEGPLPPEHDGGAVALARRLHGRAVHQLAHDQTL